MTGGSEFKIKGTRLSGRIWKRNVKPVRSLISPNLTKRSDEKIRSKWLASKLQKQEMKEVSRECKELIEKAKEERKKRGKAIKLKRQQKIENEIRSAGNNLVVVGPKKFSKMTKKARKGLRKMTPEMIRILKSRGKIQSTGA